MVMKNRILVVDDDAHICEIVQTYCEKEGFLVVTALSSKEADRHINHFKPHVIVLDIMLADEDGIEWCRDIREKTNAVIIFLSSRKEDEVKIEALSDGGDDYVTKPFSPKVLIAKMKAHLRRTSPTFEDRYLKLPGITLDFATQHVHVNGELVSLSRKEFGILALMAQSADQIIDSATLFQLNWGTDSLEDTRTVAVHMSNLRKKIESNPAVPKRIITIRNVGYKFVSKP